MVTTVRSRPSHYEVLGLTPTATSDEIAQAFVRRMSLFRARPLADVAQVTSAYETLRNPEKRREYDRSLEPKPEPKLEPEKLGWSFALAQPAWRPFIASVPTGPMAQPAAEATRAPEPHVTAQPDQKISADPRLEFHCGIASGIGEARSQRRSGRTDAVAGSGTGASGGRGRVEARSRAQAAAVKTQVGCRRGAAYPAHPDRRAGGEGETP